MKKVLVFICFILFLKSTFAQNTPEVYPTNWWIGMKWNKVQVMLHQKNIADCHVSLKGYTGVRLEKIEKTENPNYLFLNLSITPSAKHGTLVFDCSNSAGTHFTIPFELKSRRSGNGTAYAQGVRSQDLMYLIMPDRFSNGDYSNDIVTSMRDQHLNRDSVWMRHGGDIQGVINHLDYLKDLGITAVWLTPVLENDMKVRTEHGYAITNHYKVDARLGGNETYKKLSDELHKRGMKLVQDAVYNHMGSFNFLQLDPPSKDWVHQWPSFTRPNYKDQTWFDPYAAQVDKKLQNDGWFDHIMPDINQANPMFANFLIQNAIWSVEEFGVDGWRIDTYVYCDLPFMNRCNKALVDEYPAITMFGECWVTGTANEAYFVQNNLNTPFKSNMIGVTDFQCLFDGMYPAIKDGNNDRIYQTLSNDFLYKNPMNNVIFLDNHDMNRFYSEVGEDVQKLKMGIGWLLTERGVPQLYYGTEIMMAGAKNDKYFDGLLRNDFPGGWKEDKQNKFTESGRTAKENEVFDWTKILANFRKNSSAIKTGKLMQYVPESGVYTYFRYDAKQTVMVVINTSTKEQTLAVDRFKERTTGFATAKNIETSEVQTLSGSWKIAPKTIWVLELSK